MQSRCRNTSFSPQIDGRQPVDIHRGIEEGQCALESCIVSSQSPGRQGSRFPDGKKAAPVMRAAFLLPAYSLSALCRLLLFPGGSRLFLLTPEPVLFTAGC